MADRFQPLSIREGRRPGDDGPFDGVPSWLFGPLWGWISDRYPIRGGVGYRLAAIGEYRALGAALRIDLENPRDPNPQSAEGLRTTLHKAAEKEPELLLDLADYWLRTTDWEDGDRSDARAAEELAKILNEGGSIYRIEADRTPFLARRGMPEAEHSFDELRAAGRAGEHLARAWRAVYGRNPNPGIGYREAVKAVEAAAFPIVTPKNPQASLGTVIAAMGNEPGNWRVVLDGPDPDGQVSRVVGILSLLWNAARARPGAADASARVEMSALQAEAALHLALVLVNFFRNGAIARR